MPSSQDGLHGEPLDYAPELADISSESGLKPLGFRLDGSAQAHA